MAHKGVRAVSKATNALALVVRLVTNSATLGPDSIRKIPTSMHQLGHTEGVGVTDEVAVGMTVSETVLLGVEERVSVGTKVWVLQTEKAMCCIERSRRLTHYTRSHGPWSGDTSWLNSNLCT